MYVIAEKLLCYSINIYKPYHRLIVTGCRDDREMLLNEMF